MDGGLNLTTQGAAGAQETGGHQRNGTVRQEAWDGGNTLWDGKNVIQYEGMEEEGSRIQKKYTRLLTTRITATLLTREEGGSWERVPGAGVSPLAPQEAGASDGRQLLSHAHATTLAQCQRRRRAGSAKSSRRCLEEEEQASEWTGGSAGQRCAATGASPAAGCTGCLAPQWNMLAYL